MEREQMVCVGVCVLLVVEVTGLHYELEEVWH